MLRDEPSGALATLSGVGDLPNLRHLKALLTVARLRSVNRAAAEMNLSQPAVSQAVTRLEQAFGAELFFRHPTGMYLTRAGETLVRRAQRIFANLASGLPRETPMAAPELLLKPTQLAAMVAVAQARSHEVAAAGLGVTVASLHRNLRGLEARIGRPVVLRDGASMRLSRAGAALTRAAKLAMRELELAQEELDLERGLIRGRLIVGALPLARAYIAPKSMVTITTRHPALQVQLVEGGYETLLPALREGDIDILIGALRLPPPAPDVVEHELLQERLCVVARPDHPLTAAPALRLDALMRFPWVAPRGGSPARAEFDAMLACAEARPPAVLEVASHVAVRSILRESDSLALISRHQIHYEERSGELCVLPVDVGQSWRALGYTVRGDWQPTRTQEAFLAELGAVCAGL